MSDPWQVEPLGKHCTVKARIGWRGLASSEYTSDGPFLIAGKHVRDGTVDWASCDHITDDRYMESMEIALEAGDVILTKDGTIGRVARIDRLPGKATLNGTMMLLRPGARLDYRYLFHVLRGEQFKRLIDDKVSGSSIPHIFQRDMVTLPVPLPPWEHQQRIADVLDTLDTIIRQTEAIIEKLIQVKQGLLHDLLTRGIDANGELRRPQSQAPHLYKNSSLGWIPIEWEIAMLGRHADISGGVTLGRSISGLGIVELPYLRVANVQDGYLDLEEIKTVQILRNEIQRYRLEFGDVLMNEGGDFDKLGRGAVWAGQIDNCLHQNHVFRVRCNTMSLNPHYLTAYSGSDFGRMFFVQASKQTTNLASINSTQLKGFPLRLPPIAEQSEINLRLATLDRRTVAEKFLCTKLQKQKSGLMDDLLTGRVRVTPLLDPIESHA